MCSFFFSAVQTRLSPQILSSGCPLMSILTDNSAHGLCGDFQRVVQFLHTHSFGSHVLLNCFVFFVCFDVYLLTRVGGRRRIWNVQCAPPRKRTPCLPIGFRNLVC